jgi:2-methylcitrate dehydratase PrpD
MRGAPMSHPAANIGALLAPAMVSPPTNTNGTKKRYRNH